MPDHISTPSSVNSIRPVRGGFVQSGRYTAIAFDRKASGTRVIVTGDKEMRMVDKVAGLKIVSPRQFRQELTEGQDNIGAAFVGDFLKLRSSQRKSAVR